MMFSLGLEVNHPVVVARVQQGGEVVVEVAGIEPVMEGGGGGEVQ